MSGFDSREAVRGPSPERGSRPDQRPLVAHVVYRFTVGGLENGIVNLINHMPPERYRHAVISLTDIAGIADRITRSDVELFSLHKPEGQTARIFPKFYRLLWQLRPAIVHTNNLAALETVLPAMLAGIGVRVHSEHGWDVGDLNGENTKFRLIRRLYKPFVTQYITVSNHLTGYLRTQIKVPESRLAHIYNAVDTTTFRPRAGARDDSILPPAFRGGKWIVGTVGRLQAVKNQIALIRAFARQLARNPHAMDAWRLIIVGDGPLRAELEAAALQAGIRDHVWFAGERSDVAELFRAMDCFALPSLAEGISYTLLEAMASGLPVVATHVGGNGEIVINGSNGTLCPSDDVAALTEAMARYFCEPERARQHKGAARAHIEVHFSLDAMVGRYLRIYDELIRSNKLHS